ncbi:hypothetical protein LF887_09360 [Chryseobacterium sp. MEBOG06]|uniref:hypothetical protein n=1 Tax=unclassified Chryseobacterium TaxID=2593645 RepID=UPI001F305149|nr:MULTISPECIES: hypothetical protein [unclassified Chryseobacterium]UKB85808.1 hypothetical protein LF887_09360 [Chryseobacterium sp. MEBOG06]
MLLSNKIEATVLNVNFYLYTKDRIGTTDGEINSIPTENLLFELMYVEIKEMISPWKNKKAKDLVRSSFAVEGKIVYVLRIIIF